jgi:hypothetical protein
VADKLAWDVDCSATRAAMERMLRALVCTGSHFTDSFSLGQVDKPSAVTVFLRVHVPIGSEQRFLTLAGVDTLRPPPRVQVGMDMHPAEQRAAIVREVP